MTLKAILGALLLLAGVPMYSGAGTITFLDLTDSLSIQDTTGRVFNNDCFFSAKSFTETCSLDLRAPPTAVRSDITSASLEFSEPGTNISSDKVDLGRNLILQTPEIVFRSTSEIIDNTPCNGPCDGPETGGIQTAFTIHWLDGAGKIVDTDVIQFQSDVSESVPEPSTTALLFAGLAALVSRPALRMLTRPIRP